MDTRSIKIALFILVSCIIILLNNYEHLGVVYFYFLVVYGVIEVIFTRKIGLINIWNGAFVFMILSEVFNYSAVVTSMHVPALQYLIIANNLVNIGYYSYSRIQDSSNAVKLIETEDKRVLGFLSFFLPTLVLAYFSIKIQRAMYVFSVGRNIAYSNDENTSVLDGSVLSALGLLLPSVIAYYFFILKNKSLTFIILLSSPIFLILFLNGTRFPLLFSLLGFLYVIQTKYNNISKSKKVIITTVGLVALLGASTLMKQFRSSVKKDNEITLISEYHQSESMPAYITSYMSAEGIIDMTALMFNYFSYKEHLYGKSSGFIFYFWVPRFIWEDKPEMLGYWFVREYRDGFSDAHSSSFGFTGDFYADFGYFSLILIFFIGRVLKRGEYFKTAALKSNDYQSILGAMILPYTFFFVRSPITATMNFLGILFFYHLFKRLIFKSNKP